MRKLPPKIPDNEILDMLGGPGNPDGPAPSEESLGAKWIDKVHGGEGPYLRRPAPKPAKQPKPEVPCVRPTDWRLTGIFVCAVGILVCAVVIMAMACLQEGRVRRMERKVWERVERVESFLGESGI